jgi:hypothetical protein
MSHVFNVGDFDHDASFVFDPVIIEMCECVELLISKSTTNRDGRIVRSEYNVTQAGWFNSARSLIQHARKLLNVSTYIYFNPVNRERLAVCGNTVRRVGKNEGTGTPDYLAVAYLLIDIDCKRTYVDSSATQGEMEGALEVRDRIIAGRPELCQDSLYGCSDNGAFILCRYVAPMPNDRTTVAWQEHVLVDLALNYGMRGRDPIYVDVTTPSRPTAHLALPGSLKCKGTPTEERPHRPVTVDT